MAMHSHSPSVPFHGPGSPPRPLSSYREQANTLPSYGPQPRPMPPPSPQHYARYVTQPPAPAPISAPYGHQQVPHKRPGSSMSISSMLGSEPERQHADPFYHNHVRSSSHGQAMPPISVPPASLGTIMSPPQYPPRTNPQDYAYKPRSATPDRFGDQTQNRYRSGSGSLLQRPGSFTDNASIFERYPPPRYQDSPQFGPSMPTKEEPVDRGRRTSLSGILQRPESAPQQPSTNGPPTNHASPESAARIATNGGSFGARNTSTDRAVALSGNYDTRPPPFNNRPPTAPVRAYDQRDSQSSSPDLRRAQPNGIEARNLGGILNDGPTSQNMTRQESVQSQNSAFGDRSRLRAFSPFAPSIASQSMSVTSAPAEEQARKGSDELSHRKILGLANESRRGRYSPVPQVVQGAQAQTPVPDAGVKTEQGRVFAGLGGGLGSGPTSMPPGLSSSPFKEGTARLSEENLMKMSRSTSGMGKRSRKFDEDIRAESEAGDAKKRRKRSKYAHSYKIDLDENPRRGTPLSASVQPMNTPTSATGQQVPLSHRVPLQTEQRPLFKPRKTIRIVSIMNAAKRNPRRHLGTFKYDPILSDADMSNASCGRFDIGVRPNAIASFNQTDQQNCTYSIRVPRLWLQERERRMICKEAFLWGSGIYTDDSDIVAAAMHSGFIKSAPPENADKALLERVAEEQNARIEGLVDAPERPLVPEANKDALITCVVLPTLEEYPSSTRFGLRSRQWPGGKKGAEHDGVSFAIIKAEFVSGGVEARRMGRTGKERRQRLRQELQDRKRGQDKIKEMLEKVKGRVRKIAKVQRTKTGDTLRKELAGKAARNSLKEKMRAEEEKQQQQQQQHEQQQKDKEKAIDKQSNLPVADGAESLDVGQTPSEWLKQLETSAVEG